MGFASVPAAYIPGVVFTAYGGSLRALVQVAIPTVLAAIEATLGLILLVRGFLPICCGGSRPPLALVDGRGFIAIGVVHFFVE
ncbi:MAG TPA: hypothetical protein VGA48_08460 [Thermoplasmata archaeon]